MTPNPVLVVLSGPSGVGKDTVLARMMALRPALRRVVTVTTRPPRAGEIDGRDYQFVDPATFARMVADGHLMEHNWYPGSARCYGIPKTPIIAELASGHDVVLRIDVSGARTVRRLVSSAFLLFLAPPDIATLRARMQRRRSETPEALAERLALAERELAAATEFDCVVVSREGAIDAAAEEALAAIDRARAGRGSALDELRSLGNQSVASTEAPLDPETLT